MVDSPLAEYLTRLGVAVSPPSAVNLTELQRAHVSRIPYETLWLQQGLEWDIGPGTSFSRIARTGRGGYCFHLNGAFAVLLRQLGYSVTLHSGAVHRHPTVEPDDFGGHLVLQVRGLPDDTNPGGNWYVDVGLGDGPLGPTPLVPGIYRRGGLEYELQSLRTGPPGYRLTNDPAGGFRYMTWLAEPVTIDRFVACHAALSTSPASPFRRVPTIQMRLDHGARTLRGRTLRQTGQGASLRLLKDRDDLAAALESWFGLRPPAISLFDLDRVWDRCLEAHAAWEMDQIVT